MKKLFLIALLVGFTLTVQSQNSNETVSAWKTSDCYAGIDYRYYLDKSDTKYSVAVEVKNTYTKEVTIKYDVEGKTYSSKNNYITLKPGTTDKSNCGINYTTKKIQVVITSLEVGDKSMGCDNEKHLSNTN